MTNYYRRIVQGMGTLLAVRPMPQRRFANDEPEVPVSAEAVWAEVGSLMWRALRQIEAETGLSHERIEPAPAVPADRR